MKINKFDILVLLSLLIICLACLLVPGCATKNPNYVAGSTNGEPAYIVDQRLNDWSNRVSTLAHAAAPVNPAAGVTDYVIDAGFGLAFILSGLWARHKSQVASTLANGVVKAGPGAITAVLDHASDSSKFGSIASLVNNALGADRSPTVPSAPVSVTGSVKQA